MAERTPYVESTNLPIQKKNKESGVPDWDLLLTSVHMSKKVAVNGSTLGEQGYI